MGLTRVTASVRNPRAPRRGRQVRLLVDSGADYSVLPARIWKALGLRPVRRVEFEMADGTVIVRGVSEAEFTLHGRRATSPVVLGAEEDSALLGAVTLETMGLVLNPLSRTLHDMQTRL